MQLGNVDKFMGVDNSPTPGGRDPRQRKQLQKTLEASKSKQDLNRAKTEDLSGARGQARKAASPEYNAVL